MSRDRIKKLLGMTTANGCTEAEAVAAAAKAAELMQQMGLRLGDIEMDQDDHPINAGWGSARSDLWITISECTNTAVITRTVDGRQVITYVGREPGPEVATYLHHVTDRAIERELRAFRDSTWYRRRRTPKAKRAAGQDFVFGIVNRLSRRLRDLFHSSRDRALLAAAVAERDERFPNSTVVSTRVRNTRYSEAIYAGLAAGSGVGLHHGVAGDAPELRIGGQ